MDEKNKKEKFIKKNKAAAIVFGLTLLAALILLFFYSDIFNEKENTDEYMFKKEGELVISDSTGNEKVKLEIEIADTEFDRQLGLMFRKEMEERQGMLFIFLTEGEQSFWMRNTYLPLDIIFINSGKEIVTIHKNTEPLSDKSYPSSEAAKYVLEVNAGFTERYNISQGDKISF